MKKLLDFNGKTESEIKKIYYAFLLDNFKDDLNQTLIRKTMMSNNISQEDVNSINVMEYAPEYSKIMESYVNENHVVSRKSTYTYIINKWKCLSEYPRISVLKDIIKKPIDIKDESAIRKALLSEDSEYYGRFLRAASVQEFIKNNPSHDYMTILTKVALIDTMYNANLGKLINYQDMALFILDNKEAIEDVICTTKKETLNENTGILINKLFKNLTTIEYKSDKPNVNGPISFFSKYLHCHNENFPIFDSNVEKMIKNYKQSYSQKVTDYKNDMVQYLLDFYSLTDFFNNQIENGEKKMTLDEIDSALWILGK